MCGFVVVVVVVVIVNGHSSKYSDREKTGSYLRLVWDNIRQKKMTEKYKVSCPEEVAGCT